jgi:pyridoxal phosphate enzyme (YggS family)
MSVAARLAEVRGRIDSAARACGRDPAGVKLIAVSKRHPPEAIAEAYAAGQRAFGESYAQELDTKASALKHLVDLEWHFVGHLQTNKVNLLTHCHSIHSVDSLHVAAAIEKRHAGALMRAFVEVNLSGESSKAGCGAAIAPAIVEYLRQAQHIAFAGLMTMPPAGDLVAARAIFQGLAAMARTLRRDGEILGLSMGMSDDLEIAVETGATCVRVGTAIFGPR